MNDIVATLSKLPEFSHIPFDELKKGYSQFIEKMNSRSYVISEELIPIPIPKDRKVGHPWVDKGPGCDPEDCWDEERLEVTFRYDGRTISIDSEDIVIEDTVPCFLIRMVTYVCSVCKTTYVNSYVGDVIIKGGSSVIGNVEMCTKCSKEIYKNGG